MSNIELIKAIREKTGAGIVEVKKALEEAQGREDQALEILRRRGQEKAAKKADRVAEEGIIASYVHSNKKVGAIVKLLCETDFVARNADFIALGQDLAMHVTAMNPEVIKPEEVAEEKLEGEKKIWREELLKEGKPEAMLDKILSGKEKKYREERALLTQPFVKNPEITVGTLIAENVGKIGENIQVGGFYRIEL